jgi:hypothetical protein
MKASKVGLMFSGSRRRATSQRTLQTILADMKRSCFRGENKMFHGRQLQEEGKMKLRCALEEKVITVCSHANVHLLLEMSLVLLLM